MTERRTPDRAARVGVLDDVSNAVLVSALERLDPQQRRCVELRFLQNLSVAEVARRMELTPAAVEDLQYRAMHALSRMISEGGDPAGRRSPAVGRLFDAGRAARFAQLLDGERGTGRHHRRSGGDDQLVELVQVGRLLRSVPLPGTPDPGFRRDLRAMLIATAQREGIGVTAQPAADQQPRPGDQAERSAKARARGAIIIGIAAGALALSGVSVGSEDALPGDALYGVKRSTEQAQLALAGSDLSRAQLYLEFARTRLKEARAVRDSDGAFLEALRAMDDDTRQGVRLLLGAAMSRPDPAALDLVERFDAEQSLLLTESNFAAGTPAAQAAVSESRLLLDRVRQRAVAVRAALSCGGGVLTTDELGPVPRTDCLGGSVVTMPSATPATVTPATVTPSAGPSLGPQDTGLLDELGRILGGLLG